MEDEKSTIDGIVHVRLPLLMTTCQLDADDMTGHRHVAHKAHIDHIL